MATSDTTLAALLSGSLGTTQQQQDPALLALTPKMQLAQQMIGASTDMGPVASSKWGGLGKIAQALLGNYAMSSAQDDYSALAAQRQKEFDAFQNKIAPALTGGSPVPQQPAATAQPPVVGGGGEAENAGYGPKLAAALGIGPNDKIDLTDPNMRSKVVSAIGMNEGSQPGDRNMRNNNPGNLEASPWTQSQPGFVKSDGRFAIFDTPENGSAAAHALLQNYHSQGLNTPNAIAAKWAPAPGGVAPAAAVPAGSAPAAGQPQADPLANFRQLQAAATAAAGSYDPRIKAMAPTIAQAAQHALTIAQETYTQTPTGAVSNLGKPVYATPPRTTILPNGAAISLGSNGVVQGFIPPDNAGVRDRARAEHAYAQMGSPGSTFIEPGGGAPPTPFNLPTGGQPNAAALGGPAPSGGAPAAGNTAPQPGAPLSSVPYNASGAAEMVKSQHTSELKGLADETEKMNAGANTFGTTATIRANAPDVMTGKTADARLMLAQWAAAMGMSPDAVKSFVGTNPVNGELLQKKLFELSTGAVRGMGAREPGSVISMFAKNYPNMNSQNMTIDAMTRLLDADQLYRMDRVEAQRSHLTDAVNAYANNGPYTGLNGFDKKFNETNSPVVYQGAALAAAKMPYSVWSKGLSPEQQQQAMQMAMRQWNDVTGFYGPGGNGQPEQFHTVGGR